MKPFAATLGLVVLLSAAPLGGAALAQEQPAKPPEAPSVPVSVTKVVRKDVPLIIRGLGTAQAYYSVLLRPQVDGRILEIAVTEGQDVRKGDLLAVIDPRPYQATLDAAMAKKQQDEAQLANAKLDLERYSTLANKNFASRQQVETQQALVKQVTALVAVDAALVQTAQVNLSFCTILAPFDGRVGLRSADPGMFVRAAEAASIMPVAQIRPIAMTFTVPQDQLPAIQRAMAAGKPSVAAYTPDNKQLLDKGELLTIDNAIDATTGTIKVKAVFPNANYALWPGQFANTQLLVGATEGALIVPSAAVQHGQGRLYVYVIKEDKTAEARTVEIGRDDGVVAIIAKGLEEGQTVVTDGHARLRNGSLVAIGGAPARTGG